MRSRVLRGTEARTKLHMRDVNGGRFPRETTRDQWMSHVADPRAQGYLKHDGPFVCDFSLGAGSVRPLVPRAAGRSSPGHPGTFPSTHYYYVLPGANLGRTVGNARVGEKGEEEEEEERERKTIVYDLGDETSMDFDAAVSKNVPTKSNEQPVSKTSLRGFGGSCKPAAAWLARGWADTPSCTSK